MGLCYRCGHLDSPMYVHQHNRTYLASFKSCANRRMDRHPSGTVRPKHINIQRHMLTSSKAYKGTIRSIFKYKYTSSQMYKRTNGNIHSPHLHPRDRSQDWAKILSFFQKCKYRSYKYIILFLQSNTSTKMTSTVKINPWDGICCQIRHRFFLLWLKIFCTDIYFWEQSILAGPLVISSTQNLLSDRANILSFLSVSKIESWLQLSILFFPFCIFVPLADQLGWGRLERLMLTSVSVSEWATI